MDLTLETALKTAEDHITSANAPAENGQPLAETGLTPDESKASE